MSARCGGTNCQPGDCLCGTDERVSIGARWHGASPMPAACEDARCAELHYGSEQEAWAAVVRDVEAGIALAGRFVERARAELTKAEGEAASAAKVFLVMRRAWERWKHTKGEGVQKTITVCDVCGAEGARRVEFEAGMEEGAAAKKHADLCDPCQGAQLAQFIEGLPVPARVAFHRAVTVDHKFFPRERIFAGR